MPSFVASAVRCDHLQGSDCQYQVAWTLNPHMVIGSTNADRASAQHARLLRTVRGLGATVIDVPFVHGAFDSVFTKDNGIYISNERGMRAIMASPRHEQRQLEQEARARALREKGLIISTPDAAFEGGDVIVHDRVILLGHGFRSSANAAPVLADAIGGRVIPLQLVDEHLYHLDTALTVLSDGTALFCEEAFSPPSARAIRDAFEAIAISRDDAMTFALNVVEVGSTVVTGSASPTVTDILRRLGRDVAYVELDEFQRSGGSAACLLGPVHDRVPAAQRAAA